MWPTQSAFIKGKTIHENFIMAHEISHTMKLMKGSGGLVAVKLYMEKALDHME